MSDPPRAAVGSPGLSRLLPPDSPFLPAPTGFLEVLSAVPLALATDLQSGAVHAEGVGNSRPGALWELDLEGLVAPAERDVIGNGQVEARKTEDSFEETFCLSHRKVKEQPRGQRRLERQIRDLLLPTTPSTRGCSPVSDDRSAEPEGDISTSPKILIVRRPIAHTVSRLVLGMSPGAFVRFGHGFGLAEK